MRYLALVIKIVLFLVLFSFAVKNSEIVTLRYLMDWEWQAPLSLILLVTFALGLLAGLLAVSWQLLKYRRELASLRKGGKSIPPQA